VEEELSCSLCWNQLEECYEVCEDCSTEGKPYMLCNHCSSRHPAHEMTVKTLNKGANYLNRLSYPSDSNHTESMDYDRTAEFSPPKIPHSFTQSIVFIPQIPLDESAELRVMPEAQDM
jgi:hypothetical protein